MVFKHFGRAEAGRQINYEKDFICRINEIEV